MKPEEDAGNVLQGTEPNMSGRAHAGGYADLCQKGARFERGLPARFSCISGIPPGVLSAHHASEDAKMCQ